MFLISQRCGIGVLRIWAPAFSVGGVYVFVPILSIVLYTGESSAIQNTRLIFLFAKCKVCLQGSPAKEVL